MEFLKGSQEKRQALENELTGLKTRIDDGYKRIGVLRDQEKGLETTLDWIAKKKNDSVEVAKKAEAEEVAMLAKVGELKQKEEAILERVVKAEKVQGLAESKMESVLKGLTAKEKEVESKKARLMSGLNSVRTSTRKKIKGYEEDLEKKRARGLEELAARAGELKEVESKKVEVEKTLHSYQSSVGKCKSEVAGLEREIEELKGVEMSLEKEHAGVAAERRELLKKQQDLKRKSEVVNVEKDSLDGEIESRKRELVKAERKVKTNEKRLEELKGESKDRITAAELAEVKAEKANERAKVSQGEARKERAKTKKELADLTVKIEDMGRSLLEAQVAVDVEWDVAKRLKLRNTKTLKKREKEVKRPIKRASGLRGK